MSADAKVSGTQSDAKGKFSPEDVWKEFTDLLSHFEGNGWEHFKVGRTIIVNFLGNESKERLQELSELVRAERVALGQERSKPFLWERPSSLARSRSPLMYSTRAVRANLADMIKRATERDVTIVRHSKPVAVLMSHERYEDLIDQIEDLQDQLSIANREHDTVPLEEAEAELGF
ncbi:type II toxin-antitoxin system Phd/YefM family antitoxin [Nocardia jiangxiensis]|uniref:type II toxin-antitoxin system Phd/YefM family antitoxin n=1 Tax=Nocardia jiangxiensis TaxID=282685 RepID=UPI00031EB9BA|nr:type II toxin-antitoxin system prevent-host-death family antitoxin [Nocardia jiangxiensis]